MDISTAYGSSYSAYTQSTKEITLEAGATKCITQAIAAYEANR